MRQATADDLAPIMRSLLALLTKSPAPQMQYACEAEARSYVCRAIGQGRVFFFGNYMVMFDTGADWYCKPDTKFLVEQLILKVYASKAYPQWTLHRVIDWGLHQLAVDNNCSCVIAGDTQIGYMTPHYHAAGFSTMGTQLIRKV